MEATIWQRFSPEEIDRHVSLMIKVGLIRRRKIYVLVQGRRLLYVRGSVEPAWEYKVTRAGELVLKLLNLLTRFGVLEA